MEGNGRSLIKGTILSLPRETEENHKKPQSTGRDFSFLHKFQTGPGAYPAPYPMGKESKAAGALS
jgi:hypothetical protein